MRKICLSIVLIFGGILIIFGILAITLVPLKIEREVYQQTFLGYDENGTFNHMTEKWAVPPYSMDLKVWVLNITNSDDILKGERPHFREQGPYTFIESQRKVPVKFMRNGTEVLYRNKRTYIFNSTQSCENCTLSDVVTIPNVIFQKLVDIALNGGFFVKEAIEMVLAEEKRETPFIPVSVGELLFQGYEDPLIEAVCSKDIIKALCIMAQIPRRIGFFYGQNDTDDGEYLVDTGVRGAQNISKVIAWNGMREMPAEWWTTKEARMINGTDAQLFSPGLSRSEDQYIFSGPIGRSTYLRYKQNVNIMGVPAYRYVSPPEATDPTRPENKGFCNPRTPHFFSNETQPEGCLPAGFMDLSPILPGHARIYVSQPHFLHSPPIIYQNFSGFPLPSTANDETYIDIEPTTGVVVNARRMTQINVGMIAGNLRALQNMKDIIMPVLWLKESILFDESTARELRERVVSIMHLSFIIGVATLTIGLLFWTAFLLTSILYSYVLQRNEDEQQLIVQEDSEGDADE
ncbi:hypothetical protein AB6A40_000542 [Gnathostoma spinigerum]|uniref:Uncharacterized protein n=1 Tax=Gnathostoma spinigerum TaxID=75299 RepID=A0ABD6E2E4_9BILA